jgi:hypothetical protein
VIRWLLCGYFVSYTGLTFESRSAAGKINDLQELLGGKTTYLPFSLNFTICFVVR